MAQEMNGSTMNQSMQDGQRMQTSQQSEPEYKLVIDEVVVEKIASYATQKIDGIVEMKGNLLSTIQEGLGGNDRTKGVNADVEDDDKRASVDLSIILEYGKSAVEVFDRIKKVVGKSIKEMTGLDVDEMTVHVVDVMTREEYKEKQGNNNSQQTKAA
ncbi:Asp23/Gls24 family envelope stress response protein [Raoultibacter phocaeensis]|uniref:Asp23/Gls24 family envelope stress response protein n=1 Tax=Raoultibacter phocaeensis TaxID=2479841 RepID=UPI001119844C|nr:Asp23/Gls24 family envelope stress response protein [Raoultibacter phocaeensis]